MFKRMFVAVVFMVLASQARGMGMGPHLFPEYFEPPRELSLVYFDVEEAAPVVAEGLRREATRVLASLGIKATWRQGGLGVMTQQGELTVVLLARAGNNSRVRPDVLGATILGEDGARAVWLYLPHVEATLGLERRGGRGGDAIETLELGTALGRVAAHEILHALAPALPHASSGLMAERMGRVALTGPVVEVPREFQRAVRPGLPRHASND
jgi:hypothetical protein